MWIKLLKAVAEHKAGDLIDTDEAIARGYIAAGLAEESSQTAEADTLRVAREEYGSQLRSLFADVTATVREATAGLKRPNVAGDGRIESGESEAEKKDSRSIGGFVRSVYQALGANDIESHNRLTAVWKDGGYGVARGMTEGSGAAGGYTTPVIYESQILEVAGQDQVVVPKCTGVPLGARTVEWPALDQYQAPTAGNAAWFGGVKVYRKTETAQRTASAPTFAKISLTATDLTAYTEISRDLLQDSTAALDAMVPALFGKAIGWREDYEAIRGSGSGQFLGILNAPASIAVTRNTGSHIKYVDIVTMYTKLLSASKRNACWLVHPYSVSELMQLVDAASRYIYISYYNQGNASPLAQSVPDRLLGLPVFETEIASPLGTAGDLILCDCSRYLIGRRSGLEIGLSEHFKFDTDQVALRAKTRNDGQPQLKKAITLSDGVGSNTVSAFVYLN